MINIDHTYRITAVLKVKTDIITSIMESLKADVIVFICNIIMCLISHQSISVLVSSAILTISLGERKYV